MRFKEAIVRKPGRSITNGISSSGQEKPYYDKAIEQHNSYIKALEECGLKVTILEASEEFPDSVFIEDVALCTLEGAIICNPGANSRKGEENLIIETIRKLFSNVSKIKDTGTVEAGDIMMVEDHFFIGLSERTNASGSQQMISFLENFGFSGSTIKLKEILHLKTGLSYIENHNLLCWNEMSALPEFSKYNKIIVPDNEKYAANSVWINGTVLVPEGNPITEKLIQDLGYKTIALDMSEFKKLDGGLSCLSLRF